MSTAMTPAEQVTAEFMKKFTALYDGCSDEEEEEEAPPLPQEPCLKKAKLSPNNNELTADEAVDITCAACDYYMLRMVEYMPEMMDGATTFGRNAYAIAKEFKSQDTATTTTLFNTKLIVEAINKARRDSSLYL